MRLEEMPFYNGEGLLRVGGAAALFYSASKLREAQATGGRKLQRGPNGS